jgi:hypothetical protein
VNFLFKGTLFSLASLNPPKSFGLFLILSNLIRNIKSDDSIKYYNLKKGWPVDVLSFSIFRYIYKNKKSSL